MCPAAHRPQPASWDHVATIDRNELERILAERPSSGRTVMQSVRENYAEIGMMRERGFSWSEIADVLAQLGVVAKDDKPVSSVTLRSAFFLVGVELRQSEEAGPGKGKSVTAEDDGEPNGATEAAAGCAVPHDPGPDGLRPGPTEPGPMEVEAEAVTVPRQTPSPSPGVTHARVAAATPWMNPRGTNAPETDEAAPANTEPDNSEGEATALSDPSARPAMWPSIFASATQDEDPPLPGGGTATVPRRPVTTARPADRPSSATKNVAEPTAAPMTSVQAPRAATSLVLPRTDPIPPAEKAAPTAAAPSRSPVASEPTPAPMVAVQAPAAPKAPGLPWAEPPPTAEPELAAEPTLAAAAPSQPPAPSAPTPETPNQVVKPATSTADDRVATAAAPAAAAPLAVSSPGPPVPDDRTAPEPLEPEASVSKGLSSDALESVPAVSKPVAAVGDGGAPSEGRPSPEPMPLRGTAADLGMPRDSRIWRTRDDPPGPLSPDAAMKWDWTRRVRRNADVNIDRTRQSS